MKVQIDTNISQFIKTSKSILNFSFDVLQALTEECNLYETTLDKIINDINIEFRPCNYRIKVIPQAGNKFEYITKTDISPEPINLFTTNPLRIAKRLKVLMMTMNGNISYLVRMISLKMELIV